MIRLLPPLVVALAGCSAALRGEPRLTALQHETLATQAEQAAAQLGQSDATERDRLRRVAAEQRASAQELRGNEEATCIGISASDRAVGPLGAKELIVTTEPLFVHLRQGSRLRGATVVFRAVPGLTPEWLQRLATCHMAHLAAVGYGPEMQWCPMAFSEGVTVQVNSAGTGFSFMIQSDDFDTAREIARRASALVIAPAK